LSEPHVRGTPVEALTVVAQQDWAVAPFPHGEVDRARRARHERDEGGPVSLTDDAQDPVSPLEGHVLDVGGARFADPQPVQPEQHGESGVGVVEPLSSEEEPSELTTIESRRSVGCTVGLRTYWAGLDEIRPSMCAKR
jgi:hypothetical protein